MALDNSFRFDEIKRKLKFFYHSGHFVFNIFVVVVFDVNIPLLFSVKGGHVLINPLAVLILSRHDF